MGWVASRGNLSEFLIAFLMTGVLGGFTTFSAFSVETLRLMQSGAIAQASLNIALNLFISLLAVVIGWQCIQALTR